MGDKTKFLIIGISGTTNSGKTTLVKKLKARYSHAQTICLDRYFLDPDDKRLEPYIVPEVNHVNWEQFGALDMDMMLDDVEKWKSECFKRKMESSEQLPILFIEGFLIFNHSVLTNYFHMKYFITIDEETCVKRRRRRTYNPPDKPGYFEKVVWPMYLKNKKDMEAQKDIVYLDGTDNQESLVQKMASDIDLLLQQHCS